MGSCHGGDVSLVLVRDPPPLLGAFGPLLLGGGGVSYKSEETSPPWILHKKRLCKYAAGIGGGVWSVVLQGDNNGSFFVSWKE